MNKIVLFSCLTLIVLCGCERTDRHRVASDISNAWSLTCTNDDYIEILLDEQYDMYQAEFLTHINSVCYIPLDSKVPVGEIDDAIVIHDRLYVLDERSRQVLVYDLNGKIVKCINDIGHASNEYMFPSAIYIDAEGRLCIKDGQQSKTLKYDRDGHFIETCRSVPAIYALQLDSVVVNQMAEGQSFDHSLNYHIVMSVDDSIYSKCLPYEPIQENYVMSNRLRFNSRGELLIHPVLSDTIYHIQSSSSMTAKYVLKYRHSVWDRHNEALNFNEITALLKGGGYRTVSRFFDVDNYCFMHLTQYNESIGLLAHHVIYDKRQRRRLNIVGSTMKVSDYIPTSLIATSGNKCITSFNPYIVKKDIQSHPEVTIANERLRDIILGSKSDCNPVVVIYELD